MGFVAAVMAVLVAGFLLMFSNLVFLDILNEVNLGRTPNQQIRQWFLGVRFYEVLKLHRERHPESRKRRKMWVLAILGWSIGSTTALIVLIR